MKKLIYFTLAFIVACACIACSDTSSREDTSKSVELEGFRYEVYAEEDAIVEGDAVYYLSFQLGEGGQLRGVDASYFNKYYRKGEQVSLPDFRGTVPPEAGIYVFDRWISSDGGKFNDAINPTSFFMPANDVTLTATYRKVTGMYQLHLMIDCPPITVGNLSYSNWSVGAYYLKKGEKIKLKTENWLFIPSEYNTSGIEFTQWTSSKGGKFDNPQKMDATFTMPGNDTTITAHFK